MSNDLGHYTDIGICEFTKYLNQTLEELKWNEVPFFS
jgi:hypothetical protein